MVLNATGPTGRALLRTRSQDQTAFIGSNCVSARRIAATGFDAVLAAFVVLNGKVTSLCSLTSEFVSRPFKLNVESAASAKGKPDLEL